jgi:hypothetical protein
MVEQIHDIEVRLGKLRERLKSREGKPGLEANCAAIRAEIARLENLDLTTVGEVEEAEPVKQSRKVKRYRSAVTGRFITKEEADANPSTTVSETVASRS